MNSAGGGRVEAVQEPVQVGGSLALGALAQSITEFFRALRTGEEALDQGALIATGSANDNR